MAKLLFLLLFFFLFNKSTEAVNCQIVPPERSIHITEIYLKCTGVESNKVFAASFYIKRDDGLEARSYTHCGRATDTGEVSIMLGIFHHPGKYYVDFKYSGPGCTSGTKILTELGPFEIKGLGYKDTSCTTEFGEGMTTALGCIPTKPEKFVEWFLRFATGAGGGIAFLLIIWGIFQIMTSGGNPEKLNNGKDIIVSAITGLLMIIFSVVLLKIIGVDVLKIPGFQ